jgi:hypothetical protein
MTSVVRVPLSKTLSEPGLHGLLDCLDFKVKKQDGLLSYNSVNPEIR